MNPRDTALLFVLVVAVFGSWYLSRKYTGGEQAPTDDVRSPAGYYLKAARILGTGADGSPLYEINAVRAQQRGDEIIEFSDVQIRYSPESAVPWSVDADTAILYPDTQRVRLEGHVRAVSAEGFSGNDTEIRTSLLDLNPETFVAETDARVQIRIGARSLTATGMLASLNDNRLQLKSNVSGKFVP